MHVTKITLHPEKYPTDSAYPFSLEIFRETRIIDFTTPVTIFTGENGSGKSTLLEAICRKCGIHIWKGVELARFKYNPYEEKLHTALNVHWKNGRVPGAFFGSDIFTNFARLLDEWASADPGQLKYFGGKSLLTQSHGQSLMSYFSALYMVRGIYFLDEPETALSPANQLKLLKLLKRMGNAGHAQFIVATHSPILMASPGAVIYSFDRAPVREIAYEDTEHYKLYRNFLADRTAYLDLL